jgi:predicted metalloprotease with PDZ domain
MRGFVRAVAAGVAALFSMGQSAPDTIDYTLTPVLNAEGALTALQYDVRFRGDGDGESSLRLPSSWGGRDELWRSIDGLSVVSGGELRDGEGPAQRVIAHRPNAPLHVRYRVIQDFEGAPAAQQGNAYRAIVQPTYFHLIGEASIVAPDGRDDRTPVRWSVRNLPRGWAMASDLEAPRRVLGDVWQSISVGGDFRIIRDRASQVRVAIRGDWSFSDAEFSASVAEIIAGQRLLFGDRPSPYLVTVIQLNAPEGWMSIGGTGLGDGFAFFATANGQAQQITRTLAHEGLHTWIPARIGGLSRENEIEDYWLSEGFTDFYTGRVLVSQGLWTPQQFADDLNRTLSAYAQSPVRTAPNARIAAEFWTSQPVQQLPYQRGRLLATVWDARLRANGRDFDDVLFALRERARADEDSTAAAMFPDAARAFGLDVSTDLITYVRDGAAVLLPEDTFAPCGRVITEELVPFHRGFDIEATSANNNIVAGVDPTLPAYAAGVRNGMTLIRRDAGEIGNSSQEIVYVMRDGDTERTFRYMPRGHGVYTQQRLVIDDGLTDQALHRCVAVLGGA